MESGAGKMFQAAVRAPSESPPCWLKINWAAGAAARVGPDSCARTANMDAHQVPAAGAAAAAAARAGSWLAEPAAREGERSGGRGGGGGGEGGAAGRAAGGERAALLILRLPHRLESS